MRPPRLDHAGAYHHITNRGRNKQQVFRDSTDFDLFLQYMEMAARVHRIEILAYALMSNHYHLVVRSVTGELSGAMQLLGSRYTQDFNTRHELDGALFKGRFFSKLIDSERYLMESIRYVVNNPVKAGLVSAAEDYEMSSYRAMVGLAPKPQFMKSAVFEENFRSDPVTMAGFVKRADSAHAKLFAHLIDNGVNHQLVSAGVAEIDEATNAVKSLRLRSQGLSPLYRSLQDYVCDALDVSLQQVADPHSRNAADARLLLMALVREHDLASSASIAATFGLSASGFRSAMRRFLDRATSEPRITELLYAGRYLRAAA